MSKSASDLIAILKTATNVAQVLDITDVSKSYREAIKLIHPDVCTLSGAENASKKLYDLKVIFEKGKKYSDESGDFSTNGYWIKYTGDKSLLQKSVSNFEKLRAVRKSGFDHEHFAKYMPKSLSYDATGNELLVSMDDRAVPLVDLELDQMAVNWILSRLLEFSALIHQAGYTHVGLTPESVFVVPETHGIYVTSFYHMGVLDSPLKTIAGKYQHWYPTELFKNKIANSFIDIELSKKISVYLLGDKSGSGVKLKGKAHSGFLDFIFKTHNNTVSCFKEYRKFLTANFPMVFIPLNI